MIERSEAFSEFESFLQHRTKWVLFVTGLDGIGKSRFLEQMITNCSVNNRIALSLTINFADETLRQDPLSVLELISNNTANYCNRDTVEKFRQSLSDMRREVLTALNSKGRIEQYITAIGSKVTRNHMIAQQNSKENVAEVKKHAYAAVWSALRTQLSTFTTAISRSLDPSEQSNSQEAEEIQEANRSDDRCNDTSEPLGKEPRPLLICLDECQQLNQTELKQVESLIKGIYTSLSLLPSPPAKVVIASRVKPFLETIQSPEDELQHLKLTEFTEQNTQNYLELHRVAPECFRYIHNLTLGHPLCVSLAARIYEDMNQHYDEAVFTERFLQNSWRELIQERITRSIKPCYAEAIYKCAFAEFFTEDILRQVLRPNTFEYYEFTRLPSIIYRNNTAYHTIHPLLHFIINEYAKKYHPEECKHWKWYRWRFAWLCKQWRRRFPLH